MGKHNRIVRLKDKSGSLNPEELDILRKEAYVAVRSVDMTNKTTNEIFGEVYTKIRTALLLYGKINSPVIKSVLSCKIKYINGSVAGFQLNKIMNEAYEEFQEKQSNMFAMDLCSVIAQCCVIDAKKIVSESEKVLENIKQIHNDLNGVSYE